MPTSIQSVLLIALLLAATIKVHHSQMTPFSIFGASTPNFMTTTQPSYETRTGLASTTMMGHALGLFTSPNSFVSVDALTGYAYGAGKFDCATFTESACVGNSDVCIPSSGPGGEFVCANRGETTNMFTVTPNLPNIPRFHAKLHLHAKGTVRSLFVDIDTRTRIGEMPDFRKRAEAYFYEKFGLNFEYFNTFEGAQLIPFKWTDELYLQVHDAVLPQGSSIIPERNRVLVDGFLVKPLFGETVVLKGDYAASKGRKSVFLEADEVLLYMEYKIVDMYNRLYHKFRVTMCSPLKTNRIGIAGWNASVIRIDHELEFEGGCKDCYTGRRVLPENDLCRCSCYDPNWGIGNESGIIEIVEYDGIMDVAVSSVLTFPYVSSSTPQPTCNIRNNQLYYVSTYQIQNPDPAISCEQTI